MGHSLVSPTSRALKSCMLHEPPHLRSLALPSAPDGLASPIAANVARFLLGTALLYNTAGGLIMVAASDTSPRLEYQTVRVESVPDHVRVEIEALQQVDGIAWTRIHSAVHPTQATITATFPGQAEPLRHSLTVDSWHPQRVVLKAPGVVDVGASKDPERKGLAF
jgi:hypothetical protein